VRGTVLAIPAREMVVSPQSGDPRSAPALSVPVDSRRHRPGRATGEWLNSASAPKKAKCQSYCRSLSRWPSASGTGSECFRSPSIVRQQSENCRTLPRYSFARRSRRCRNGMYRTLRAPAASIPLGDHALVPLVGNSRIRCHPTFGYSFSHTRTAGQSVIDTCPALPEQTSGASVSTLTYPALIERTDDRSCATQCRHSSGKPSIEREVDDGLS
jgi:hypothetical protein